MVVVVVVMVVMRVVHVASGGSGGGGGDDLSVCATIQSIPSTTDSPNSSRYATTSILFSHLASSSAVSPCWYNK